MCIAQVQPQKGLTALINASICGNSLLLFQPVSCAQDWSVRRHRRPCSPVAELDTPSADSGSRRNAQVTAVGVGYAPTIGPQSTGRRVFDPIGGYF